MSLWHCRYCGTNNPQESSFCQTCGRRPDKEVNYSTKNKKTSVKKVDEFLKLASSRFMESDFCLLEIYAEAIKVISSIVLIIGIIFSVVTFIEFGFFYGLMELIGIIVIAIQGFLSSIFIRFLLELKKEGNQTTQFTYVNAKLLQEVLDTLKSIENKDNK